MMRPPIIRAAYALPGELVVDNFAGGGGASTGLEAALGRPVDIAINHSPTAIAMHRANHPETRHFQENIWAVDPREACGSRPVGMAWFSPDCTHHSRARGGKPRDQGIRGLAWVVLRWAHDVRPRVILLENVEEFETWGPLRPDGTPDPERVGSTFRLWLNRLRGLGYRAEFRSLVAADYGTPTSRRRLFLVARCDGGPLVWPDATHGAGREQPWRAAAEIIDWSLPCPSIFERRRPLAEATQRRIAEGIRRYVMEAAQPFIINTTHSQSSGYVYGAGKPLPTVVSQQEFALVAPTLIQTGYGERPGQAPRALNLGKPLGTVVAGGSKHALVSAFLTRHFTGVAGRDLRQPVPTVTAVDHHSLTTATLMPAEADHSREVRAFLVKFYKSGGQWQGADEPLHTVTTRARFGLVTVAGEDYQIADIGMRMLQPPELFAAQGFPRDYVIDLVGPRGKLLTKSEQTDLAGNAVCPQAAEALASAQLRGAARAEVA